MKLLSPPDLFIDATHVNLQALVGMWPNRIAGPVLPIGASACGDLFFQRSEGNVEKLDVLQGGV